MRYLAIDLGKQRTGLAVGDEETRIATPLYTIDTSDAAERIRRIHHAINEHSIDALVVGLPINMDGTEGPAARAARSFSETLASHFNLPVHLVDERLSSHEADVQLRARELTRRGKRARVDCLAAATILNDFLRDRPN